MRASKVAAAFCCAAIGALPRVGPGQVGEVWIETDQSRVQAGDVLTVTVHADGNLGVGSYGIRVASWPLGCVGEAFDLEVLTEGAEPPVLVNTTATTVEVAQRAILDTGTGDPADISGPLFRFKLPALSTNANRLELTTGQLSPLQSPIVGLSWASRVLPPLTFYDEVSYGAASMSKGFEFIDAILSGLPLAAFVPASAGVNADGSVRFELPADGTVNGGILDTGLSLGAKVPFDPPDTECTRVELLVVVLASETDATGNPVEIEKEALLGRLTREASGLAIEFYRSPFDAMGGTAASAEVSLLLESDVVASASVSDPSVTIGLVDAERFPLIESIAWVEESAAVPAGLLLTHSLGFVPEAGDGDPDAGLGLKKRLRLTLDGVEYVADTIKVTRDLRGVIKQLDANVAQKHVRAKRLPGTGPVNLTLKKGALWGADILAQGLGKGIIRGTGDDILMPDGGEVVLESIDGSELEGVFLSAGWPNDDVVVRQVLIEAERAGSGSATEPSASALPNLFLGIEALRRPGGQTDFAWTIDVALDTRPDLSRALRVRGVEGTEFEVDELDPVTGTVLQTRIPAAGLREVLFDLAPATPGLLPPDGWQTCVIGGEDAVMVIFKPTSLAPPGGGGEERQFRLRRTGGDVPLDMKSIWARVDNTPEARVRWERGTWERCSGVDIAFPVGTLTPADLRTIASQVGRGYLGADYTLDEAVDFFDLVRAARIFDRGCGVAGPVAARGDGA